MTTRASEPSLDSDHLSTEEEEDRTLTLTENPMEHPEEKRREEMNQDEEMLPPYQSTLHPLSSRPDWLQSYVRYGREIERRQEEENKITYPMEPTDLDGTRPKIADQRLSALVEEQRNMKEKMEQMLKLLENRSERITEPFYRDPTADAVRYDCLGVISRPQNEFSSGLQRLRGNEDYNANNSKNDLVGEKENSKGDNK